MKISELNLTPIQVRVLCCVWKQYDLEYSSNLLDMSKAAIIRNARQIIKKTKEYKKKMSPLKMNPVGLHSYYCNHEKPKKIIYDSLKNGKKSDGLRTVLFFDKAYCSTLPDILVLFSEKNDCRLAIRSIENITVIPYSGYDEVVVDTWEKEEYVLIFDRNSGMYDSWTKTGKNGLINDFYGITCTE